jgi:hypothetical protein
VVVSVLADLIVAAPDDAPEHGTFVREGRPNSYILQNLTHATSRQKELSDVCKFAALSCAPPFSCGCASLALPAI